MKKKLNKIANDTNIYLKRYLKSQRKTDLILPMAYGLLPGGKKVRSKILIDIGKIFKIKYNTLIQVGAAVECIHAYSLIHDDLPCMDNDNLRRGKLSTHKKFGESTAILAGNSLLTIAFQILSQKSEMEYFDQVVFATHSDDTLTMLADPNMVESRALGAIKYQPNQAVLHHDQKVMPKNRNCWASWVYAEGKKASLDPIGLTYWMNSLQPIPETDPMFVTLNLKNKIDPYKIYDEVTFRHPVYDLAALEAQKDLAENNGKQNTWFCGAWMKNGFHEDGLASAMDIVDKFSDKISVKIAAQ